MVKMKNRKGFSLLELVVVVGIIGIIAVAVMLNAGQFTFPAQVNTWKTSMESLKNSLTLYATTRGGGSYPEEPPSGGIDINTWLTSETYAPNGGAYFLDKPITNPFKGGAPVYICKIDGTTFKPVNTASATECVIKYETFPYTDPISGMTIDRGGMRFIYQIGTQTTTVTVPGTQTTTVTVP